MQRLWVVFAVLAAALVAYQYTLLQQQSETIASLKAQLGTSANVKGSPPPKRCGKCAKMKRIACPADRLLKFDTNFTQFILNTFDVARAAVTPNETRPIKWLFSRAAFPKIYKTVPKDGLVLEFGVFRGETLRYVAQQLRRFGFKGYIGGFDSWEGLPVKWRDGFDDGAFGPKTDGDIFTRVKIRFEKYPNVRLHRGWFQETIPPFLAQNPAPITHLHIDGDLFISAAIPLQLLNDRIVAGSLITFDELYKYKDYKQHEILEMYLWMGMTGNELCALANRVATGFDLNEPGTDITQEKPLDQSISFQVAYGPEAP